MALGAAGAHTAVATDPVGVVHSYEGAGVTSLTLGTVGMIVKTSRL